MIKFLTTYLIDLTVAIVLTILALIMFIVGCLFFPFKKIRGFWAYQINRIVNIMEIFYREEVDD